MGANRETCNTAPDDSKAQHGIPFQSPPRRADVRGLTHSLGVINRRRAQCSAASRRVVVPHSLTPLGLLGFASLRCVALRCAASQCVTPGLPHADKRPSCTAYCIHARRARDDKTGVGWAEWGAPAKEAACCLRVARALLRVDFAQGIDCFTATSTFAAAATAPVHEHASTCHHGRERINHLSSVRARTLACVLSAH